MKICLFKHFIFQTSWKKVLSNPIRLPKSREPRAPSFIFQTSQVFAVRISLKHENTVTTKVSTYPRRQKVCSFHPVPRCSSSATWPTARDWVATNTRRPLRHPPLRSSAFYTRVRKPPDYPKTRNRRHSWALEKSTTNVFNKLTRRAIEVF